MAENLYYTSPQTSQLRASTSTRQALLDTIDPESTDKDINQAADRINSVYNERLAGIRRKYAEFPEMASAEEGALERDRANDLARATQEGRKSASESTRSLMLNLEQMDEGKRRFDAQMGAQSAAELNAGFREAYIRNAEKRERDQARQDAMGNYQPLGSSQRTSRGNITRLGADSGDVRLGGTDRESFVADRIQNKNFLPQAFSDRFGGSDVQETNTGNLYDKILGSRAAATRMATADRSNVASRSRPVFRPTTPTRNVTASLSRPAPRVNYSARSFSSRPMRG